MDKVQKDRQSKSNDRKQHFLQDIRARTKEYISVFSILISMNYIAVWNFLVQVISIYIVHTVPQSMQTPDHHICMSLLDIPF